MSYTDERMNRMSATKVAHLVIDRLKKVDKRWELMSDKFLHQSCPVYKYIYQRCERAVNQRKKNFDAPRPSRTPTPRRDTMKDLIEMNYTTSRSSSSAASEQITTEDKTRAQPGVISNIDPPKFLISPRAQEHELTLQDNESSLMLMGSPAKIEPLGMQEITTGQVIAARRRIKQLQKELQAEERRLNHYRTQL